MNADKTVAIVCVAATALVALFVAGYDMGWADSRQDLALQCIDQPGHTLISTTQHHDRLECHYQQDITGFRPNRKTAT